MAETNGSIEEIVEQIVCTVLLTDKEYLNVEDKSKRKMKYDQQKENVNLSINQMCKRIEKQLPEGKMLSGDVRLEIANQMLVEVKNNPFISTQDLQISDEQIIRDLIVDDYDINENENENVYMNDDVTPNDQQEMVEENVDEILATIADDYGPGSENVKEIVQRAHSADATQDDKDMNVNVSMVRILAFEVKHGVKFKDLDEFTQGLRIKTLRTLITNGDKETADKMMRHYGITPEILNDEKFNNVEYEDDTIDSEDSFISQDIDTFAGIMSSYFNNIYDPQNPENNKKVFAEIIEEEYEKSNCKIDYGLEALTRFLEEEKSLHEYPEMLEWVERFCSRDINDKEIQCQIDGHIATRLVFVVNKLNSAGETELAKKLCEGFNDRAKESNLDPIDFDKICALDRTDLNTIIVPDNKRYEDKNGGYDRLVKEVTEGKIVKIGAHAVTKSNIRKAQHTATEVKTKIPNGLRPKKLESSEHRTEVIRKTLNDIYKRCGMTGIMKCMDLRISEMHMTKSVKSDWLCGYTKFLDIENNPELANDFTQSDIDIIAEQIKNVVNENSDMAQSNPELYKFVQISNGFVKGRTTQQLLSADKAIPTLIEETSEENSIFERKDVVDKTFSKAQDDIAEER